MFAGALKSFAGSNISTNYEKSPNPSSHCGPWRIHDAKRKKTGQPYSVFVFDRKVLDNGSSGSLSMRGSGSGGGLKAAQDEAVERLKREAGLLARLRHPCVLELVEPVEETRGGGLQFVTELVTGSLGTLLVEKDEEERSGGGRYVQEDSGRRRRREVEIDELEIQKGLVQLGKALEFLHESANLIHGNLTPDAVMINAKSDWKICGLGFSANSVKPELPPQFDPRLPPHVQLSLDYAAPELVLDQDFTMSCDMFSLGMLIIALYNYPHKSPLETHNSVSSYRRLLSSQSTTPNSSNSYLSSRQLPRSLVSSLLPVLITRRSTGRVNARDFQQNEYFDNILVSTLRFLDNFPAKTPSEKQAFMRGLPKILPQFPRSVLEKKILPGLVEELRDGTLLALILPNIFQIVEQASARLFSEKVLGKLKEVFLPAGGVVAPPDNSHKSAAAKIAERERESGREGGLTAIISKLGLIKEKTTALEFKDDILPLLHLALESPTHALQDLALRSLPTILPKLDFPTLKNELFPIVAGVFTKTSSLGIKIRTLEAFRVLCGGSASQNDPGDGLDGFAPAKGKAKGEESPVLDKYTIQEKVIPLLKGIKTKEPAVMMEALSVFSEIGNVCDREVVAMDILPTLWAMSFGPLLGLEQFKTFMSTIRSLSNKIETEQIRKLSELASTSASSAQTAGDFLSFGSAPGLRANGAVSPGPESDFEALVFGKTGGSQASITDGFEWQSSSSTPRTASPAQSASVAAKTKSPPRITSSEGPKFSWSSPNPTATQPPLMSNVLTPSSPSSASSFAPLRPSAPALQPGAIGFGSTTALRPQQPQQQPPFSGGTSIDWSAATRPKQQSASASTSTFSGASSTNGFAMNLNSLGSPSAGTYGQQTSNNNAFASFGIPPPPPANNTKPTYTGSAGGMGATSGLNGLNFGGSSGTMTTAMGVGLPPPMAPQKPGHGTGTSTGATQPQKERQGLDKWESLL